MVEREGQGEATKAAQEAAAGGLRNLSITSLRLVKEMLLRWTNAWSVPVADARPHCIAMPRQGPRAAATAAAAVQLDRRTAVLSLLATQLLWSGRPARAAGLTKSLQSKEGFEFLFPEDYVVAFDRSGGSGTGAVAVRVW